MRMRVCERERERAVVRNDKKTSLKISTTDDAQRLVPRAICIILYTLGIG